MEAEACHSLGVAQHALGDHAAAVRHHRAELELAHRLALTHLQVTVTYTRGLAEVPSYQIMEAEACDNPALISSHHTAWYSHT